MGVKAKAGELLLKISFQQTAAEVAKRSYVSGSDAAGVPRGVGRAPGEQARARVCSGAVQGRRDLGEKQKQLSRVVPPAGLCGTGWERPLAGFAAQQQLCRCAVSGVGGRVLHF